MATAQVIHSLQTGGRPGSVSAAAGADLVKVYNGTVSSVERYTGGYSWGAADGNFGYRRSSQARLGSQRLGSHGSRVLSLFISSGALD